MANKSQLYFIGKAASAAAALDYFTANDAVIPNGSPAFAIGRNSHPLAVFQPSVLSFVDFQGVLPDSGVVKVSLLWVATAILGSVLWKVAWERDNPTFIPPQANLDVDSFAAPKSVLSLAPAALGLIREASLTFTPAEMGGILPGEPYRLRVTRNGVFAIDTMVGDAQLFRVVLGAP